MRLAVFTYFTEIEIFADRALVSDSHDRVDSTSITSNIDMGFDLELLVINLRS